MFDITDFVNVSPEVMEFLIQEYNTGIVRETINTTEQIANKVRDKKVDRNKVIGIRRFFPDLEADSQNWRNRQIVESTIERSKFFRTISEGQIKELRLALSGSVIDGTADSTRLKKQIKVLESRYGLKPSQMFTKEALEIIGDPLIDEGHEERVKYGREEEKIFGAKGHEYTVKEYIKRASKATELNDSGKSQLREALSGTVLNGNVTQEQLAEMLEVFKASFGLEPTDLLTPKAFEFYGQRKQNP